MKDIAATIIVRWGRLKSCFVGWASCLFAISTTLLSFVSLDSLGWNIPSRILVLVAVFLLSAVGALLQTCWFSDARVILQRAGGSVRACYGDIFQLSKSGGRTLCVIPVNTAFDTIVEDAGERPLVSPNSLHGKLVSEVISGGLTVEELDARISSALAGTAVSRRLGEEKRPRGKRDVYEVGTVVPVVIGETTYLLVALSEFDEENVAGSTRAGLITCLERMTEYYDRCGQGNALFLPLMGTGRSRMNLSHVESFEVITSYLKMRSDVVHGEITVVVYEGDTNKVSIWA